MMNTSDKILKITDIMVCDSVCLISLLEIVVFVNLFWKIYKYSFSGLETS